MPETKQGRLQYVDVAKAFAIFLVVLGHPRPVEDYGQLETFLYAFHMPLFFMLSGVFVKQKASYSWATWKSFLSRNFLTLILPYIVWVAIYMPFTYIDLTKALYGSWIVLRDLSTLSSLWFLPVLFLARTYVELMFCLSWKCRWKSRTVMALAAAVFYIAGMVLPHNNTGDGIGMPWGFDIAFVAAAFMLIGALIRPLLAELAGLSNWAKLGIAAACLGLLMLGTYYADYSAQDHQFMLMANAEYGSPILCLANGLTGSLMVIMLAQIVSSFFHTRNWALYAWLLYIGQNTMGIYLIHKPFLQGLYNRTLGVAPDAPYLLRAVLLACIAIAFSLLLIALLSKYSGEILGRPQPPAGLGQNVPANGETSAKS